MQEARMIYVWLFGLEKAQELIRKNETRLIEPGKKFM
jgi:hypothetical protein